MVQELYDDLNVKCSESKQKCLKEFTCCEHERKTYEYTCPNNKKVDFVISGCASGLEHPGKWPSIPDCSTQYCCGTHGSGC